MIKTITKEQREKIPAFIEKWVSQVSKPMNEEKAIEYTTAIYKRMGEEKPIFIFGDSPISTVFLAALFFSMVKKDKKNRSHLYSQLFSQLSSKLHSQLDSQLYSQLYSQLRSQLYSQLDSQLYSQLYSQLRSQLDSQLYSQLYSQLSSQLSQLVSQLYSQLYSRLFSQLYSQLDSQLNSQLNSQIKDITSDWYFSIWCLVWCGLYEYGKMIGIKFDTEAYDLFINFSSEVSFIIPYKGICFISHKPNEIYWKNGVLHNEKSGAVKYKDGYSLYSLNGINMQEKYVLTPAEKIDVQDILKEENVDVRRELIRKVGIERFILKAGAKVLDKKGDYELFSLKLSDEVPDARYLKMKNPSMGIFHVEGVEGDTVQEALNFRAGLPLKGKENWEPSVLT